MRIWIIHQHAVPPIVMGPTRHFDLARTLINQGHEVYIFAGNYCHNNFHYIAEPYSSTQKIAYYSQVPFIWFEVPAYKKNSVQRLWNMVAFAYKLLRSKDIEYLPKPDVIIGSSPSPFAALAAQKVAQRLNVPFVYEIRDLWPQTLVSLGKFSKRHPLVKLLQAIENYLFRRADKLVSVLPGVNNYLREKKITGKSCLWLPNAVDLTRIDFQPPLNRETFHVLYAGSFNLSNDVATLLYAAKILQKKGGDHFRIKLLGEGPLKESLQEIVKNEQIKNVEFVATVAKEKVYTLMSSADICIGMVKKSKLYRYGTSLNKVTDYLAIARPVIFALDSPYNPISEAKAGLTVEPENPEMLADAILKLAAMTQEERVQLGMNGRKYAQQHFSIQKIATNLMKYINL